MQPKNEYGYRPIDTSKETKQDGDEIWQCGAWCISDPYPFARLSTYRRRISPGEGFEIVPKGTMGTREMEYTIDGIAWFSNAPRFNEGHPVNVYDDVLAFRRRKQPAAPPVEQSPWRPIGDLEGLPESGLVLIGGADESDLAIESVSNVETGNLAGYFTHWQPIVPVPAQPKPMTEEEALAYAKLSHAAYDAERVEEGWNAHKEFIKKGGGK